MVFWHKVGGEKNYKGNSSKNMVVYGVVVFEKKKKTSVDYSSLRVFGCPCFASSYVLPYQILY